MATASVGCDSVPSVELDGYSSRSQRSTPCLLFSRCSTLPADAARRRPGQGSARGSPPRNKGQRYPADPPTVDEIVAVMRQAGHDRHGHRLNALIVVLWRAGLRIHEALSLTETDLDQRCG